MKAKKLVRDLIEHASKQLATAARRHVRRGMGPASAARAAIRETQALFPPDWRLGVQGDDSDDFVEVWEVEHKRSEPIARIAREPAHSRKARHRYFAELNERGSVRDRFGPFASKLEATRTRQHAKKLFQEKRLDQVRSSIERFPSNVPSWMKI